MHCTMWDWVIVLKLPQTGQHTAIQDSEIKKDSAEVLRLASLKQGTMYTMEKTLTFKSGSMESGKQEVWGKKTREIELTEGLEADRGKQVLWFWWTKQNLIRMKSARPGKKTAENNVIKWMSAAHGKCLKMAFTKREMERKQNMSLCLKATYRKLLRAKEKRKNMTWSSHLSSLGTFWRQSHFFFCDDASLWTSPKVNHFLCVRHIFNHSDSEGNFFAIGYFCKQVTKELFWTDSAKCVFYVHFLL